MTSLANSQNLPPPQSPFVDQKTGDLSQDGYSWLINLLNQLANAVPTATVDSAVSAAGITQATATPLTSQWNLVVSTAHGTGVLLETLEAGQSQDVMNVSGGTAEVYPPSGFQINGQSPNSAYALNDGDHASFKFFSDSRIAAP